MTMNDIESTVKLIENDVLEAKYNVKKLGLTVCDNVVMLCYALEQTRDKKEGVYLECGVFRGSTLLTAHEFCKIRGIDRKFIGVDTFSGFVERKDEDSNDAPSAFDKLLSENMMTREHYDLAKKRMSTLSDSRHLTRSYFEDVGKIVFEQAEIRQIELRKGAFEEVLPDLRAPIAVMHIDCDLYASYLDCLKNQYRNVDKEGIVVFDEYYSLKYPGARIAVNEFLTTLPRQSYSLRRYDTNGFERWFLEKHD